MKPILLNLSVPITTPRLLLRPPEIGDGAMVNKAILESFDTLSQFMPWAKVKPSVDETEEIVRQSAANWILKRDEEPYLPLFIFELETQEFLGATGYHHINWEVPCLETGYWIKKSSSGKGYMTEAVNAITQYAFNELGAKRIAITCDVDNFKSQKIPERLGYVLEARLRANRRKLDTQVLSDTLVYAKYNLEGLPSLAVRW